MAQYYFFPLVAQTKVEEGTPTKNQLPIMPFPPKLFFGFNSC
jgi:hypothetical protein